MVTDNLYFIAIDVSRMTVLWKRLIDNNDPTQDPPMRFTLAEKCCVVLKKDFDAPALYGYDPATGMILWRTDPKVPTSPRAMHSVVVSDKVIGIIPGAGRDFAVVGLELASGKALFKTEFKDCQSEPVETLFESNFGEAVVLRLQDNQSFAVTAIGTVNGKCGTTLSNDGIGPFGEIGRVSSTVQSGRLVLYSQSKGTLMFSGK
jgi:hypothetical protein